MQLTFSRILAASFVARVEHYATLPSTQDRAREAAANPFETLPLLVVADEQTTGRGRDGNSWWSGAGNLAFSLLFDPAEFGCPRRAVPSMSLAASVAIIEAIGPHAAGQRIGPRRSSGKYTTSARSSIRRSGTTPHCRLSELASLFSPRHR